MVTATPDIKTFFKTLDACTECKFSEKFTKYADYLSIAKIEDTTIISGKPTSKNVDYVSDNIGQEYFEVTLGSSDSVITQVRFTYKQFPPKMTVEQEEFLLIFKDSVAKKIAVTRLSSQYSFLYNHDLDFNMFNSNYMFNRFDEMFALGTATRYSVAFVNIKHVNQLNKYFGSDIAGSAIKLFGAKLNNFPDYSKGEFAVHLGGDNFVVVIYTSRLNEFEKFISSVPISLVYGGDKFEHIFKCRAGITTIRSNHRFGTHVMGECSQAFNYSKKNNVDIVHYSDDLNVKNHNNTETLSKALNEHKFLIYYQPIVNIKDKPTLFAAEALARWPLDGKIVSPQEFITLATDTGIVTKIDFYVLENVCKNIKSWQEQGLTIVPISINFSGRHLFNASFVSDIIAVIDKYGIDHSLIGIEFSEPDFTQRMPVLQSVSQELSKAGINVSLDKFSTGQSTLTLLHDIETRQVKIDADRFDPEDSKGRIITNSMINLAKLLGYKVVCSGVTSQKHIEDLKSCGCNYFQSFYFDKPLSERFFIERLKNPVYED